MTDVLAASQNSNCGGDNGYSLPCNRDIDPWKNTRTKMDTLTNQADPPPFSVWSRLKYGQEKVKTIVETPEKLDTAAKATAEAFKKKTKEAAAASTETVEKVAEQAKGAKKWLQKGAKMLSVLSAAAQFAGPVLDIILLFSPLSKSSELTAIESGFAKVGAQIDSVSYKIEKVQDALDWNAVVPILLEFEATVDYTTEKYENLVEEIKNIDSSKELPLDVKNNIEHLVNTIETGEIGTKLQLVNNIFEGTSGFTNSKTLLETFALATDNDCSKILPMSNKLMQIVKDGQRLQYFYEINQQLVDVSDDIGFPSTLYKMYKTTMEEYTSCTRNAADYAQKEMKRRHGSGESPVDVIDAMEPKYDLYNWAALKEFDKEDDKFALIDNCGSKRDVELTGLSDDDKEKQRFSLFGFKKSSKTEVDDAIARTKTILVSLVKADLPIIDLGESWGGSGIYQLEKLKEVRKLLENDSTLKSLIDTNRLTMVMFKKDSQIDLYGWHFKSNMEILHRFYAGHNQITEEYLEFTVGYIFTFEDTTAFSCDKKGGNRIEMSFEGSHPYCLCKIEYGDKDCKMNLAEESSQSMSNSVLDLIKIYKVPGMFDLQDEVKKGTETIMTELNHNKEQIFEEMRKVGGDLEKTKNAILSAQSVMLNDLKASNAKVLKEVAGLKVVMDAAFEKQRNDYIYLTEKGNAVVIGTIKDANRKVTDDINKLTGKVIENRYFKELKLHIPVFQDKFENAINYGGFAEEDFNEYLRLHEQDFQASKVAAKKGVTETTDSFVVAQMQVNMVDGCTDQYHDILDSTWKEMFELNLAVASMEMWDLEYQIKNSDDSAAIEFHKYEQNLLREYSKTNSEELKAIYEKRSCPEFSLSSIYGGGCKKSVSYPGQTIPVRCSDNDKTLVLASTGQAVPDLVCKSAGTWEVYVADFACIPKCMSDDDRFDIGEKIRLPAPLPGFQFTDVDGNVVTETTCLAPVEPGWNTATNWMTAKVGDQHEMFMKTASLQIKSDSATGSGDMVHINFVTATLQAAGGISLYFEDPMQYELLNCTIGKQALNNVPAESAKLWTINRVKDPDRIKIECNSVEVANFDIGSCTNAQSTVYGNDITRVIFVDDDTASDSFRRKKKSNCVEDNDLKGANYRGNTAVTKSGRECQRWESMKPNGHSMLKYYADNYPHDDYFTENYCRNPDNSAYVWCYNNEAKSPRLELCDVPRCSASNEDMLRATWSKTYSRDINECATAGFCRYGGTCANTEGSFTCTCPSGYKLGADKRCIDDNECDVGNVGFNKCLVQDALGKCANTVGSYSCTCLPGSFSSIVGGTECQVCDCNKDGVLREVCDGGTGKCLCKSNVAGARCDACKVGYTSYPLCTQCAAGFYSYPNCLACNSCVAVGVTAQRCDKTTGACLCKPNVAGTRCDKCKPDYKNYPSCAADVKHGTLSVWSAWTKWIDQGTCGPSYATGYIQKRTRTRTCDDSTKNKHGRSCMKDNDPDTDTRFQNVCAQINEMYINLPDYYHAGTTAYLWLGIKQGHTECTTWKPTWDAPDSGPGSYVRAGGRGCTNTFDKTKSVSLWLYSDSNNDVYIRYMGVEIGGTDKRWNSPGSYTNIDHDTHNGWHNAS